MRIRSALTSSVLAVGILLGGAGAALADDGVEIGSFSGGHSHYDRTCKSLASVPTTVGPVYTSDCHAEGEKEWADAAHLGAN